MLEWISADGLDPDHLGRSWRHPKFPTGPAPTLHGPRHVSRWKTAAAINCLYLVDRTTKALFVDSVLRRDRRSPACSDFFDGSIYVDQPPDGRSAY